MLAIRKSEGNRLCGLPIIWRNQDAAGGAMSDLKDYIGRKKRNDREFVESFDDGYSRFKIGAALRKTRKATRAGVAIGAGRPRKTKT